MNREIDVNLASQYVQQKGSSLDKLRLRHMLYSEKPEPSTMRPLMDLQNKDGGFPSRPRPGSVSSVDNTLTSIWQLDELGFFPSPTTDRALEFLISVQRDDGGWDENPALPGFDLAPWVIPGDRATRLYLSAYSAYWLGLSQHKTSPAFTRGLDFLATQQDEAGQIPGFQHNQWLGIGALAMGGSGYAQNVSKGIDFLASQPFYDWEDSQLAWAIDSLTRAGMSVDTPWIAQGMDALAARQAEDGSWAGAEGPGFTVSATLQVIKLFQRSGRCGFIKTDH